MGTITTDSASLITLAGDVLGLLSEYPLNILTAGLVLGVVFGIIYKTKKVAR